MERLLYDFHIGTQTVLRIFGDLAQLSNSNNRMIDWRISNFTTSIFFSILRENLNLVNASQMLLNNVIIEFLLYFL